MFLIKFGSSLGFNMLILLINCITQTANMFMKSVINIWSGRFWHRGRWGLAFHRSYIIPSPTLSNLTAINFSALIIFLFPRFGCHSNKKAIKTGTHYSAVILSAVALSNFTLLSSMTYNNTPHIFQNKSVVTSTSSFFILHPLSQTSGLSLPRLLVWSTLKYS